jgi:hypothetical protein
LDRTDVIAFAGSQFLCFADRITSLKLMEELRKASRVINAFPSSLGPSFAARVDFARGSHLSPCFGRSRDAKSSLIQACRHHRV